MPDHMCLNPTNQTIADGLSRIRVALGVAAGGWGSRIVFVGVGVVYLMLYLVGIGDLWITAGPGELTVRAAANPSRAFAIDGLGRFGAIGVVYLGGLGLTYLFSPLNLFVALLIGGLAGANAALTYRGIRQPRESKLDVSTFALAGIPPLLLGAAILGPPVILLADVAVGTAVLIGLRLLVPTCALLLIGTISLISRQIPKHDE